MSYPRCDVPEHEPVLVSALLDVAEAAEAAANALCLDVDDPLCRALDRLEEVRRDL